MKEVTGISSLKAEKGQRSCFVNYAKVRFTAKIRGCIKTLDTTSCICLSVPTMWEALSFTSQQPSCR